MISMSFLVKSPKKHPETSISVKMHQKADFGCPGPLKTPKKCLGLIGVCAPGPPKPDFHPEVLKCRKITNFCMKLWNSSTFTM